MIPTFNDRKEAADKARQAMLEKFRAKAQESTEPDPALVAQREELAREREAKRAAAEEKRKARVAAEKAERAAAAKAAAAAAENKKVRDAVEARARLRAEREAAEIRAFELQAARDLQNAAQRLRKR